MTKEEAAVAFAEAFHRWNTTDTGEHLGDEKNGPGSCPACLKDAELMQARNNAYNAYLFAAGLL